MTTPDPTLAEARRLLTEGAIEEDFRESLRLYLEYLKHDGPDPAVAWQGAGICAQRLGKFVQATDYFEMALRVAEDDFRRGTIHRDLSYALTRQRKFVLALRAIEKSLQLLSAEEYPEEYFATIGFRGRLWMEQGDFARAILDLFRADMHLRSGSNPRYELYNLLHLAAAFAHQGLIADTRATAQRALTLAQAVDPSTGRPYGSEAHVKRAQQLLAS